MFEVPAFIVEPATAFHPVLTPLPSIVHVLAPHVITPELLTVNIVPQVIAYPAELNPEFTVIVVNATALAADNVFSFTVIVGILKLVELVDIVAAGVVLKVNVTVLGMPDPEKVQAKLPPM